MVCNAFGKATEATLLLPENARAPMVCNAFGKATEAKLLHPENALGSSVGSDKNKRVELIGRV